MVSRFMNCFRLSYFPRNAFLFFVLSRAIYCFSSFLWCQDLVDIFSHILLYLLIQFCCSDVVSVCWCYCCCCLCLIHCFFTFFHQRCSSTSPSNSTECFYVPWSWTDHLPRRNKRHRKQSQWPLLLSIEWVYSLHRKYLVERSTLRSIRKLFLFTGCLCYNSSSDAVFLDGRFLLDADRGNLSLPLRCESL